jgi:predicted RNA-binding protein with PUA-like domain
MAAKQYWLVKQEPDSYPWEQFIKEGGAAWTGVRNFQSRNNLRGMQRGDLVLYYHSGEAKEIVGMAKVAKPAYPDPTATAGDWSAVDLKPVKPLKTTVTLQTVKADEQLKGVALVRQSRLSVTPLTAKEFERLLQLGQTSV